MSIAGFDHVAIPMQRVREMLAFYRRLGFRVEERNAPRYSVHFGPHKINLQAPEVWGDQAFTLRGPTAVPGCGDFCFRWTGSEAAVSPPSQACSGPTRSTAPCRPATYAPRVARTTV